MAIIKDCGIVLREYDAGESNKKLVLLTKNSGKVITFAKGSKRVGSKLSADLFCYNEFIIFDGGDFLSLNQISPIRRFGNIPDDFSNYCIACYLLEIVDSMILPSMETADILNLTLRGLHQLSQGRMPATTVFAAFTFKFLQMEGFAPLTDSCIYCEKYLLNSSWLQSDGLVCDACAALQNNNGVYLSEQAKAALEYILTAKSENTFGFRASPDVQEQLYNAANYFLAANVDTNFKSLAMLKLMPILTPK